MAGYPVRSFAFGEVSQDFAGRTDADFYRQSCRVMENFLAKPTGPAEKRPGSIYAGTSTSAAVFDRGDCESTTAPMVAGETTPVVVGGTWARDGGQAHAGTYSYKGTAAEVIDRGDCENATAPMIAGETTPYLLNCTFARDGAQKHGGTYSYKMTAGTVGTVFVNFTDNNSTSDLHGFIPGETYTFSIWVYIPSGGMSAGQVYLYLADWTTGWEITGCQAAAQYDTWQKLTVTRTIRSDAVSVYLRLYGLAGAGGQIVYADDLTGSGPFLAHFVDSTDSHDLHGFFPSQEYSVSAWVYIPASGIAASSVKLVLEDCNDSGTDATTATAAATYDAWQELTVTRTIRSTAYGARFYLAANATVAAQTIYSDDVAIVTTTSDRAVLHSWKLGPTSATVIAFGHGYIHFYRDGAVILSGGVPYSKTTTYTLAELPKIRMKQVSNVAYITCPGHKVAKLTRTADDNWTLADVTFTVAGGTQDFSADYPSFVELYEDRLVLARTPLKTGTFYGSKTATYETFTQGTTATDAWEKTPQAKANNEILWILAGDAFLFGTSEGIYRVGGKEAMLNPDVVWWPNIQSDVGSSDVQAIMAADFAAFVGRGGRHVYRFQYTAAVDQYVADPLTELSEHLAKKIIGIVHQRHPAGIIWAWTNDGTLLSGSYSRSRQTIGWTKHDLGGLVESACVIPTNVEDQVWLVVAREIGGTTVRHIEYFAAREWDAIEDYHGVDDAVVVDNGTAKTVTSISKADPAVCTATLHGFSNDDKVRFAGVTGITAVNGTVYTVKSKTDNTFQLYNEAGDTQIDFSAQASAGSGGTVEKVSKVVTGLTHLEGRTVKTWGDGATVADEVVSSGSVTLDSYCNKIRTGLGFTAALEPMPVAEAQNKLKQVKNAFMRFFKTADAQIGPDSATMADVTFEYPEAFYTDGASDTSITKNIVDGFSKRDATIRIESKNPGPCTVTSLILELGEIEQ